MNTNPPHNKTPPKASAITAARIPGDNVNDDDDDDDADGVDATGNDEDAGSETIMLSNTETGRLDKVLSGLIPSLSRGRIQSLILAGHVRINDHVMTECDFKLPVEQTIHVHVPASTIANPVPQNIPLDILYEDDDVIVLNKQIGLVVHPAAGNLDGTLVNALLYHCANSLSGINGVMRPGIVHRLDKDTSGVMIVAKNDRAHRSLSKQLMSRTLSRIYHTVVWGVPQPRSGRIETQLGRSVQDRKKVAVIHNGGKTAITDYTVKKNILLAASLVECQLQTGRTHQIRVHMQHLGNPLVGDTTYGRQRLARPRDMDPGLWHQLADFPRQALHASTIKFHHPSQQKTMRFTAEPPDDFAKLLKLFD